ncbi:hypothetical protein LCGC14_2582060 [marine sediment metagenome]|uniref:Uncharacterized protein n=1 Tax=marine sediment metagenome TaxID=412755 RepID=A0A0F9B234_9ZZZZ
MMAGMSIRSFEGYEIFGPAPEGATWVDAQFDKKTAYLHRWGEQARARKEDERAALEKARQIGQALDWFALRVFGSRGAIWPGGCGKLLGGLEAIAVYMRPDVQTPHFGLRLLCSGCQAELFKRGLPDYVIGRADRGLRCDDWIHYDDGQLVRWKVKLGVN